MVRPRLVKYFKTTRDREMFFRDLCYELSESLKQKQKCQEQQKQPVLHHYKLWTKKYTFRTESQSGFDHSPLTFFLKNLTDGLYNWAHCPWLYSWVGEYLMVRNKNPFKMTQTQRRAYWKQTRAISWVPRAESGPPEGQYKWKAGSPGKDCLVSQQRLFPEWSSSFQFKRERGELSWSLAGHSTGPS